MVVDSNQVVVVVLVESGHGGEWGAGVKTLPGVEEVFIMRHVFVVHKQLSWPHW